MPSKEISRQEAQAINREFNRNPDKGLERLYAALGIPKDAWSSQEAQEAVGEYLYKENQKAELDERKLGEVLTQPGPVVANKITKNLICKGFLDQMNFEGKSILQSLRELLQEFQLPGEGPAIDRLTDSFAERYFTCSQHFMAVAGNPPLSDAEKMKMQNQIATLAMTAIQINTMLHRPNSRPMDFISKEQYVKMYSAPEAQGGLSKRFLELLSTIYDEIKNDKIKEPEVSLSFKNNAGIHVDDFYKQVRLISAPQVLGAESAARERELSKDRFKIDEQPRDFLLYLRGGERKGTISTEKEGPLAEVSYRVPNLWQRLFGGKSEEVTSIKTLTISAKSLELMSKLKTEIDAETMTNFAILNTSNAKLRNKLASLSVESKPEETPGLKTIKYEQLIDVRVPAVEEEELRPLLHDSKHRRPKKIILSDSDEEQIEPAPPKKPKPRRD